MSAVNKSTPVVHQNPPQMDENEFNFEQKLNEVRSVILVLYDLNVGIAVVLGLVGVLMFLTILNGKLRSVSPVWYYYHLIALSVVTALLIHTFIHGTLYRESRSLCFFLMYTTEYIFFAVGMNMILLNAEIYFTTVLPLQKWQWSPFIRFVISILIGWNAVALLVNYIVVNNNDGRNNKFVCFYIKDKSVRSVRNVLQITLPAALCFVFTIILIGTHCLKRSRFTVTSASGELREVKTVRNEGEMEWTRVAVFVNTVYVLRCSLDFVINYSQLAKDLDTHVWYLVVLMIHATTMYLLPLGLLFVSDARAVLKAFIFKAIALVSCGKVRLGEDLEQLAVSFGQDSGTTAH